MQMNLVKETREKDADKMMSDVFNVGMHPQPYFWRNPYQSDVPLRRVKSVPKVELLAGTWHIPGPAKLVS